jgi:hypothetical protein
VKASRRGLVRLAVGAVASLFVAAHTPYGQWTVYRQRNLFIVASREDPSAVFLARFLADGLLRELPESHAMSTRAADSIRVASLLATGQLDVAVIARAEAGEMLTGAGEYKAVGAVPIRTVSDFGSHLLVAVETFKTRHAYLLAGAIEHIRMTVPALPGSRSTDLTSVPNHPGAAAFSSGAPLPGTEE